MGQFTPNLRKGVNRFFGSTDLTLKSTWIVDFCSKLSRFADFKNIVDDGSAVNFDMDLRLRLS